MNTFTRYYSAIAYLEGLSNLPLEKDFMVPSRNLGIYLKRMRYFLDLIGSPDQGIKYIHVTGTAGKGSVTNMLHEILYASGKRVGSFTSPFVTTSIEKIKVGSLYIAPDEFADIVDYLKPYIDQAYLAGPYGRPSYFEIFLAIGFMYFKQKKCEWVVLEVGLGGRFDATNVIESPVVTAITTIDYDHTKLLGNTLKKIALDKAGIIKKGSQFFTAEQRPALLQLFADICASLKVPMMQVPMQDDYMTYNTALVTSIAEYIGIESKYIKHGIKSARLQCRFEVMQKEPYVILDGAHNRSKIASTIVNLRKLKKMHPYKKVHIILGLAENKDESMILDQIVPLADSIYFTRFQIKDRKCAHPKQLEQLSQKFLKKDARVTVTLDPHIAMDKALKKAKSKDIVLVAGSFFLAGEMRKRWCAEEKILKKRKGF